MKKKIVLLFLSLAVISSLTACGGTPTAEELMAKPFGEEELTSGDMDMEFIMDAKAKTDLGEENMQMSVGVDMDVDVLFDNDTTHVKGDVSIEFLGMTMNEELESYIQKNDKEILSYDKTEDEWNVEIVEDNSFEICKNLTTIDPSIYKELLLGETKKDDSEYVVTGILSCKDMAQNIDINDLFSDFSDNENIKWEDLNFNMKATFNKKTKMMTSIALIADTEAFNTNEFTMDAFEIKLIVNEINNTDVSIPSEITKNAISNSSDDLTICYGDEENIVGSVDWTKLEFTYNAQDYKLGEMTCKDFLNKSKLICTDYSDVTEDYTINPGESKRIYLGRDKDDYDTDFVIEVLNDSNKAKKAKDCIISGIKYDVYWNMEDDRSYDEMFFGDTFLGDREVDLESLFGTCESFYTAEEGVSYSFIKDFSDGYYYLDIFKNDKYGITSFEFGVEKF